MYATFLCNVKLSLPWKVAPHVSYDGPALYLLSNNVVPSEINPKTKRSQNETEGEPLVECDYASIVPHALSEFYVRNVAHRVTQSPGSGILLYPFT